MLDDSTGTGPLTVNGSGLLAALTVEITSAELASGAHITGGVGNDTVQLVDTSGIVVSDAEFVNLASIEILKIGGAANDSVTLGADANAEIGGAGHTLTLDLTGATGGVSVDASAMTANLKVLLDSIGNDVLTGGSGNDIYQFAAPPTNGNNQITDFNNVGQQDSFAVSAAGFHGGLTQTTNVASKFESSGDNTFASTSDRFHFDTTNHGLYYSANGTTASEVLLATVTNGTTVHASDIHIVA